MPDGQRQTRPLTEQERSRLRMTMIQPFQRVPGILGGAALFLMVLPLHPLLTPQWVPLLFGSALCSVLCWRWGAKLREIARDVEEGLVERVEGSVEIHKHGEEGGDFSAYNLFLSMQRALPSGTLLGPGPCHAVKVIGARASERVYVDLETFDTLRDGELVAAEILPHCRIAVGVKHMKLGGD